VRTIQLKGSTDAMGLDDTKALFIFVGAEYPFLELKIILLEDVKKKA
jgi:hypothetical protein